MSDLYMRRPFVVGKGTDGRAGRGRASRKAKSGKGQHRGLQVNTAQAQHAADHLINKPQSSRSNEERKA